MGGRQVIYYTTKGGAVAWFFARLVRADQPNTRIIFDGSALRIDHPSYMPTWATRAATPSNLHDLMYHIWNARAIETS